LGLVSWRTAWSHSLVVPGCLGVQIYSWSCRQRSRRGSFLSGQGYERRCCFPRAAWPTPGRSMPWRCHRCQSTASVRTCAGVASELKRWAASVRLLISATACRRTRHHNLGRGIGGSCWSFRAVQRVLRKTVHRASLFACRQPFAISDAFGPLNSILSGVRCPHPHQRRKQHLSGLAVVVVGGLYGEDIAYG